jgi:formylglycine-generating enzyme required for sulfatase activity
MTGFACRLNLVCILPSRSRFNLATDANPVPAPMFSSALLRCRCLAGLFLATVVLGPVLAAADAENTSVLGEKLVPVNRVSSQPQRVIPDLGIEMVRIEPGTFRMGSAPEEPDRNKAEGPQMTVTLSQAFWLGKTPVTQRQYEAFTGKNPSSLKQAGKDAPVENVSWTDAMKFCAELTEREKAAGRLPAGYVYTLPTEAQWEYACRAGTTGSYAGEPDAMAWYNKNSGGTTHPVGLKRPNAWGLYDMLGNVLEWCYDWYGDYRGGEVADPKGPASGYFRMARGGSWRTEVTVCRSAARAGGSQDRRDYTLGFRLALAPAR